MKWTPIKPINVMLISLHKTPIKFFLCQCLTCFSCCDKELYSLNVGPFIVSLKKHQIVCSTSNKVKDKWNGLLTRVLGKMCLKWRCTTYEIMFNLFLIARKHHDTGVVESEIERNSIIWITHRKVRKNFVHTSCKDPFPDRDQILKDFANRLLPTTFCNSYAFPPFTYPPFDNIQY